MGANILDVFISSDVANHDRRIEIPGFKEWGIGRHTTHMTENLRKALPVRHGHITTSNSFQSSKVSNSVSMKDDSVAMFLTTYSCSAAD